MTNSPEQESRIAQQLDRAVQGIIGWPGMHSFTSTPIWVNTLLQALPDSVTMSRSNDVWTVEHSNTSTIGKTLPIALGRLIVALKGN